MLLYEKYVDRNRKTQLVKMRRCHYRVVNPNAYIYKTIPATKAQYSLGRKAERLSFSINDITCSEIVSPRNDRETLPIKPQQDLNNDKTSKHTNIKGEISWGPIPQQRTTGY